MYGAAGALCVEKTRFGSWYVAAGASFLVEKRVFGVGTLPQAPFVVKKTHFGSWSVAAVVFWRGKTRFCVGTLLQALFFVEK